MRKTLKQVARDWEPTKNDVRGKDKQRLIRYLLRECSGAANAQPISRVMRAAGFGGLRKEQFQTQILVPLRKEGRVFVGTSSTGIYLITDAADAATTIDFYTSRLRSETRQLRTLKRIARQHRLFERAAERALPRPTALVYIDESGVPSLKDTFPYFIVAAVIVENTSALNQLRRRLTNLREDGVLPEGEVKSTDLNKKKYTAVLKDLSLVDYEWAAVCFEKKTLTSRGFRYSETFYKYASQFLIGRLLDQYWQAELYFDENAPAGAARTQRFFDYLRRSNAGVPRERLKKVSVLGSETEPFIQLADLVAGVVKQKAKGTFDLTPLISEKEIFLTFFPPRADS